MKLFNLLFFLSVFFISTSCSNIPQAKITKDANELNRVPSSENIWATGAIVVSDRAGEGQLCKWAKVNATDEAVEKCQARGGRTSGSIVDSRKCHCSDEECTVSVSINCN